MTQAQENSPVPMPHNPHIPNYLTEEEPVYIWSVGQVIEAGTNPHARQAAWNSYQPKSSEEARKHPLTIQLDDIAARCTDWDDEFMMACTEFGLELYDVLLPLAQGEKTAGQVLEDLEQTRPVPAPTQDPDSKPTAMHQPNRQNDAPVMSFWIQELINFGDKSHVEYREMRKEVNQYLKRMARTQTTETSELLSIIHRVAQHHDPEVTAQGLAFSNHCWQQNALQIPEPVGL